MGHIYYTQVRQPLLGRGYSWDGRLRLLKDFGMLEDRFLLVFKKGASQNIPKEL